MGSYVQIDELRGWLGSDSVDDDLLEACLDDAEASLRADLGIVVTSSDPNWSDDPILDNPEALFVARPETLRRAQRGLARRNSPEGIAGFGDLGAFRIPPRDPDSQLALNRLRAILKIPIGIA